jgi:hypothetical protein
MGFHPKGFEVKSNIFNPGIDEALPGSGNPDHLHALRQLGRKPLLCSLNSYFHSFGRLLYNGYGVIRGQSCLPQHGHDVFVGLTGKQQGFLAIF